MENQFSRTENLIGKSAVEKLKAAHVAVFGIGGVGGFVCEALARAGIGKLTVVDSDHIVPSNINRQIIALHSTLGKSKVDAIKERIGDINPEIEVEAIKMFYLPETADELHLSGVSYIVDAVDTVIAKIELAVRADKEGIPIIASMGTGNKLEPTQFEVTDISKTSMCPLAKVVRKELRLRGIEHMKVVYSKEQPRKTESRVPSSISFVPSVAGLIIAGEVIKDIGEVR